MSLNELEFFFGYEHLCICSIPFIIEQPYCAGLQYFPSFLKSLISHFFQVGPEIRLQPPSISRHWGRYGGVISFLHRNYRHSDGRLSFTSCSKCSRCTREPKSVRNHFEIHFPISISCICLNSPIWSYTGYYGIRYDIASRKFCQSGRSCILMELNFANRQNQFTPR